MPGTESYPQKVNFCRRAYRCAAVCKYFYDYAVEKDSENVRWPTSCPHFALEFSDVAKDTFSVVWYNPVVI